MRGRFAPSPTGDLHLGNLRTALLAWFFARSAGSGFGIRIEDLDVGRVRESFVEAQLSDLRALGIDWDGEPSRQSERLKLYAEALGLLRAEGRVYRCFCSRREVREAASATHGPGSGLYPGTCRELPEFESDRRADSGEQFALRLRAEGVVAEAADTRHGIVSGVVDDLVLLRGDGAYAYNLAVVVDDADQRIEQVVRGDDLLPSTPDQAHLCDLLGLPRPVWTHVPLVHGPDGERLAKRHGAVTLRELADHGVSAERVTGLLALSLGLASGDGPAAPADLVAGFDPERLPQEPSVFDPSAEA